MPLEIYPFLQKLTDFPHRGTGTIYDRQTANLISQTIADLGFNVREQTFKTPKTYVSVVYWLIGGLIFGLIMSRFIGWFAFILIFSSVIDALLYFDWRYSPVIILPQNIIGNHSKSKKAKIVLMAHYDSAPVSALYSKQTANGFRNSIRLSMALITLCIPAAVLTCLYPESKIVLTINILLIVYFILQATLGTIDYFRKGYTNGASDNATGVTAAIATAERLKDKVQNCDIELVLTSAEEAGMVGAYYYWKSYFDKKTPSFLINFDTLGAGNLKLITKTGSWTTIIYDNAVTKVGVNLIKTDERFTNVQTGSWHTADFDSVWFARGGVPCVTLAALDQNGLMPRIHRPEDILDNVDTTPMLQAIDFAEAIALELDRSL
jgi:Zn-dependent M28 family amino/carboxypeptidase